MIGFSLLQQLVPSLLLLLFRHSTKVNHGCIDVFDVRREHGRVEAHITRHTICASQ